MAQITQDKQYAESITSDDILGKKVIDSHGEYLGIAEKLHIDPENVEFLGISIDKGFLRKGLTIGQDYIHRITNHAIILKIRPAYNLKGIAVFDKNGKKVGTVVKIVLQGKKNEVKQLLVRRFHKTMHIPDKFIEKIGDNVFLKISTAQIETLSEE